MSDRRPLWAIIAALLLGAAALWGSSRLVWAASLRVAGIRGPVLETQTGAEYSGALVPLAVLAVAGIAGVVATGGWPRRLLGGVLALAGLAAGWIAVAGTRFGGFPESTPVWQVFTGRGLALLGGILLLLGGLLATRRAGAMPRLGARYATPGARKAARDPGADLWEALSEGEDPTNDH